MTSNSTDNGESPLEFPCQFPIKVMGRQAADFDARVVAIVGRHVDNIDTVAVKTRPSSNGNYVSVTITIEAHSRDQLDAIYLDLTACPDFLMVL